MEGNKQSNNSKPDEIEELLTPSHQFMDSEIFEICAKLNELIREVNAIKQQLKVNKNI